MKYTPFCVIGSTPQHMKYNGEISELIIGDRNTIERFCTINPGTIEDKKNYHWK